MTDDVEHSNPNWPAIPYADWRDTAQTLHMWTQIIGKIRMVQSPWLNHAWHVTLYVTPRGMTTGTIPHDERTFSIDFDFIDHQLVIESCEGHVQKLPLVAHDTADFYNSVMSTLGKMGLPVTINTKPNEVEDPIPFPEDRTHSAYDAQAVNRFWRALYQIDRVFNIFRGRFGGKSSPVHFFWGSFDLAVTRFSGRPAPDHPGGVPNMPLWVAQEAYSHEVSSAGFWPGGDSFPEPIFYSYAYPTPEGFSDAKVGPDAAYWVGELGEFVLPYEAVRQTENPDTALLAFLQTTFDAAASLADWDLASMRRRHFPPGTSG
ncbi:MAG: hypothetical protein JSU95_10820 [Betaproteobacteria bacterium]|nr:MAG: hypothetical protein JSU95_10820 [Betaproteobacteria bacterium]